MVQYILQSSKEEFQCRLIAYANGLRLFGKDSPEPGTPKWDKLVQIGRFTPDGPSRDSCLKCMLGIRTNKIGRSTSRHSPSTKLVLSNLPLVAVVAQPITYAWHAVLIIGGTDSHVQFVNYLVDGPVLSSHPWDEINWWVTYPEHFRLRKPDETPVDICFWDDCPIEWDHKERKKHSHSYLRSLIPNLPPEKHGIIEKLLHMI
jgi:hypothetical protein